MAGNRSVAALSSQCTGASTSGQLPQFISSELPVQAAEGHPYVANPSAGRVGSWFLSLVMGAVLGCCVVNPDGGDYTTWLQQVQLHADRRLQMSYV